jgi:hypothetical protein
MVDNRRLLPFCLLLLPAAVAAEPQVRLLADVLAARGAGGLLGP